VAAPITTGPDEGRPRIGSGIIGPVKCPFIDDDTKHMPQQSNIGRRRAVVKNKASPAYAERRAEIVAAAVRVFNQRGLEEATMGAVAAELGIDRASLYYYIASKEELFDELVQQVVAANLEIVTRIAASDAPPRRKLEDLLTSLMASYGAQYPLFYIYIRENLSKVTGRRARWARQMRKLNHDTVDLVITMIEQGYADGSLRAVGPAPIVAYGLFGIIGWTHRWYRPDRNPVSAAELGRMYAELLLGGIEVR